MNNWKTDFSAFTLQLVVILSDDPFLQKDEENDDSENKRERHQRGRPQKFRNLENVTSCNQTMPNPLP